MVCESCEEIRKEIEELREELCKLAKGYTQVSERLFKISHKKRETDNK